MNMLADILGSTILFAVPLLLVALGGMFSERAGVVNIALEGIMIVGALFATLLLQLLDKNGWGVAHPQLAMTAAVGVAAGTGVLFSLLLAFAAIHLQADQTIGGTALNTFAPAFAISLAWAIQGQGQTGIPIPAWVRMGGLDPAGGFFHRLFFKDCYLTTPLAALLFVASLILLTRTVFGLRLMACGEDPQAAGAAGISVGAMRYAGVMLSGALGGIGGLAFTVAAGAGFEATVGGYGFLALAVLIFGNWRPWRILAAALFFALFKVIGAYAASIPFLPQFAALNRGGSIYQMLPYVVTLLALIFTSRRARAPKAAGGTYEPGGR